MMFYEKRILEVRGCLEMLSTFFSQTVSAPRTQFEAPKEVLHKLQFFVELLHGEVCGAVPNTLKGILTAGSQLNW